MSWKSECQWPRELRQGMSGPDVRRLQEWLCLRGLRVVLDGEFGPATRAALQKIEPDGLATFLVLDALTQPLQRAFEYDPAPEGFTGLRAWTALVARAHLARHPREVGGDNRGPWVRAYCGADGPEYRWCAGFALSCVRQAAEKLRCTMPLPFTLSCDDLALAARKQGRLTHDPSRAKAGDLFLVKKSATDWIHVGIVAEVHVDHLHTIEGNTNDEGSANGFEVCARTRGLAGKDYVLLG